MRDLRRWWSLGVVTAAGLWIAVRAVMRKFEKHLRMSEMAQKTRWGRVSPAKDHRTNLTRPASG
jgi:hypothetical protein